MGKLQTPLHEDSMRITLDEKTAVHFARACKQHQLEFENQKKIKIKIKIKSGASDLM
jgi:hypothetical protein